MSNEQTLAEQAVYLASRDTNLWQASRGAKELGRICHNRAAAAGWWTGPNGEDLRGDESRIPTHIGLFHSEISEGFEAFRKDKQDEHLPHRKGLEVELADAVIRIFDVAQGYGFDLAGAIAEKLAYNALRADHKPENRAKPGGKRF